MSSGVHGRGVGVALSFLVEGQQRHVRHLDDLRNSKNPPKRPTKNSPRPQKDPPRPQKDPCLRECSGIYGPPSAGRGLGEHTSLSAFDLAGSHGIPFRGGALAPSRKPQPLFHAGSRKVMVVKLPRTSSGIRLRQRCAVAHEPRAASTMVPWIVMGRGVMQMGWLLDGLLDVIT